MPVSKLVAATCVAALLASVGALPALAQTQDPSASVASEARPSLKRRVAVGRFTNSTPYGRLLLAPGQADPIAVQASDMLTNALVGTGHFFVFERGDLESLSAERALSGAEASNLVGVDALLLGSITQLGRRNEGKQGFLNSQRRQAVNATVEIRRGRRFRYAGGL